MNKSTSLSASLRAAAVGLVLSVLTILFGQGMGIIFGLNEDAIKSRLNASASAVLSTTYKADDAGMKSVLDKSWTYMQRAHLHAGAMGTTALALTILLSVLGTSTKLLVPISVALGGGGLGYSVFWMWAGFLAPGLGSTGLAKESLKWLAMPSSGAFVLATVAVLVVLMASILQQRRAA